MKKRRVISICIAIGSPLLGAGCGSSPLPALPPLTSSLGADALPVSTSPEQPVEVYSKVARGALKCWFGPEGSLKQTHVFHAKVDPPASGGMTEIGVHTREEGSNHGVLRAYTINFTPSGGGSLVQAENFRFPEPQARLMHADVARWVSGQEGCSVMGAGGWQANDKAPGAAAPTPAVAAAAKPAPAKKP